jgi:MFS family permease
MDHTGAIVGPLIAAVLLWFAPGEYRLVFALTIIPGAVAVALLFLVPEVPAPRPGAADASVTRGSWSPLPRRLWVLLATLLLFSLGNSADAFLLLRISETLGGATYVPLLWSAFHIVKASLSTWGGALSDRLGRKQGIVVGWSIYAVVYLGFATASSAGALVAWFLVYGVHFALTEGAERALVADLVPPDRQGAAFGIYNATLGAGALAANVLFGALYAQFGTRAAFGTGAGLAALAALVLVRVRMDADRDVNIESSNVSDSRHQ